jgi:hypothetical protein
MILAYCGTTALNDDVVLMPEVPSLLMIKVNPKGSSGIEGMMPLVIKAAVDVGTFPYFA